MQKLAEICVRRPVFAAVLILILVVIGAFGYTKLGVDRFPQVENPTVSVQIAYPGTSAEAMETEITEVVEQSVNTIDNIDTLSSTSSEGVSSITVQFNLNKDADVATEEVRDKVNLILANLPLDIQPPKVQKQDPDSLPIIGVTLSGTDSVRNITEYANQILTPELENASGVGEVTLAGGALRQINIIPDPYLLRAYGLSITDLINAVQNGNVETPGGIVQAGKSELSMRTMGRVTDPAQFGQISLKTASGGFVRIRDVAKVEDSVADPTTDAEIDGKPTVLLYVRKQSGVNTLATIEAVKAKIVEASKSLPPGYEIRTVRDQSLYIEAAVHAVEEHLVVGSILAILVVLIFLLNWRATLISALSIPASIISTFGLLWAYGYTLNIITLLALTLAVGIVIDDAIVVIENIYRVMEERGLTAFDAAIEGTREIGLAVLATTLSLIAVFLPVAFMQGMTGRLLSSFGITMSFAIMVSLLVSFTLAPSFGARMLGREKPLPDPNAPKGSELNGISNHGNSSHGAHGHGHDSSKDSKFFAPIDRVYTVMLKWSMAHRPLVVLACVLSLASVPMLYSKAPFNFLPDDDESQFQISSRAPEGTSLDETTRITRAICADLKQKVPGIAYTLQTINGYGPTQSDNAANVYVAMVPIEQRTISQNQAQQMARKILTKDFAPYNLRLTVAPMNALPGFGSTGGGRGVQYVISGPNLDLLASTANGMLAQIRKFPGVADADTSYIQGQPEAQAHIDRDAASDLGVDVNDISNTLEYFVGGQKVTTYIEQGYEYEVHIRGPLAYRSSLRGINLWTVPSSTEGAVYLNQVVDIKPGLGPTSISRLNQQRQVTLLINTAPGASAGSILTGIQALFDKQHLPPGYTGAATGSSREQLRALQAFEVALTLSVIFMYLILAAQFESWLHPLTILLSLPLTVPFALVSVVLFGQSLNIYSALGILLLFGVVKKNAILQVDHTNQLREKGMSRYDAIIQANRDRLRPILMTTLAFVAGMLPLIVSSGTGAGTNRAIGSVIFGGQTLSLLLTLLATPVAYSLLDDLSQWVVRLRGGQPHPHHVITVSGGPKMQPVEKV